MIARTAAALLAGVLLFTACGDGDGTSTSSTAGDVEAEQRFPDVVAATAELSDAGWNFTATVSSPYDSPERYADAWRVVSPDGDVLGVRELTHDHAAEQPFTRSLSGIEIPTTIREVTVEARDLENGWGGSTVTVELQRP